VEGRGGVPMICPSLKNIEISITYIVSRETGYETLQALKAIKKTQQFMFKVLQPCTLWLNNLTRTILLVGCSSKIQNLLLYVHSLEKKPIKKTGIN